MRLVLQPADDDEFPDATCVVLLALNDSYSPVRLDHRLLVGPNLDGPGIPVSVEPSAPEDADDVTVLGPWCFYGRLRSFPVTSGQATFHGYLVTDATTVLLPAGPADPAVLVAAAEPLRLDLDAG